MELNNIDLVKLDTVADEIIKLLDKYKVFTFFAEMGAGKTTLVKLICTKLKVVETPNSPTFTIVNEYNLPSRNKIIHIDAYRIKTINEALEIGLNEVFEEQENIIFVEWATLINEIIPKNTVKISILVNSEFSRNFIIECP
jgi:tRNA threonylcarbamoyladenosine biosynthesis protein TsaE